MPSSSAYPAQTFKTPPYQEGITETYLNSTKDLPPFFYYDKTGRGTPDVAALGIGFAVVVDGTAPRSVHILRSATSLISSIGQVNSVGGTSCAAPTFSAIVSLLNEVRFAKGKPSLGFLNNWIYQVRSVTVPVCRYSRPNAPHRHTSRTPAPGGTSLSAITTMVAASRGTELLQRPDVAHRR